MNSLEAERAAISANLLFGRQMLWLIYKGFARDGASTDRTA